MTRVYFVLMMILTPILARAQSAIVTGSSAAPLAAPTLPDTGTGWLDFLAKLMPIMWGILSPMATQAMAESFPKLFQKVPKPILMVVSSMLGAAAGALAGGVDGLVLDAGGIKPEVGAVEGAVSAMAAHKVAAEVTPGAPAKAQP